MDDRVFLIDKATDDAISERCPTPNWGDSLLNWLGPKLRQRYYDLISSYSCNKPFQAFINGIRAEYGIDAEMSLDTAYSYYLSAGNENESYALYKLYTIHRVESEKFKIKRDKNWEMYYLYKSMAYSDSVVYFNNDTLYNVDAIYEIALHLDLEDQNLDKTNQLFLDMKDLVNNPLELRFVEAMTLMKFNVNEDDIINGVSILHDLADSYAYPDAMYKLASYYAKPIEKQREKDGVMAEKYFEMCNNLNFSKCYNDYAGYLYQEKKFQKCGEIVKKGAEMGNFRCFFLYYDFSLSCMDFVHDDKNNLYQLIDLLVDDIITGNLFAFFEFFYLRRIMSKHFNLPENQIHLDIQIEFCNILMTLHHNKHYLDKNFQKGVVETEFLLSYGFINYIGIPDLLKSDYAASEVLLKRAFSLSTNQSYKRFCYTYIFKIRKRRQEISDAKLEKTKCKLFKIYEDSMNKGNLNFDDFSSSYLYFLAKLYENGWGPKLDDVTAYCYYSLASQVSLKYLGTGSIISYFRKYKALNVIQCKQYVQIKQDLEKYKQNEMMIKPEDDALCYICYEYHKDVIFLPCKHMTCMRCFNRFKDTRKCPECRGRIIIWG